ncbi:Ankyrin repeat and LEM domain-containing protein 2 -like protein [Echinococcus granulosus]|uniref:Ankyrin domain repeat containing protein n=1 Tax=Echinococcus granulosus TaxID=6210 RepID=U6IXU0_ECHGR|nr:Ankyrin repeat and LEM domain-containing protein [Echinococcus granulosus]EUB64523.1 Ankyrin repeat and LEM domain-containing protein [Echinococcus granulosus]KAH9285917.1 Ankyrin repeat and LEM domain-containing protein 2 -like protein [Echinococcus granulosus]CDS16620.1 ankyrin domain repeat containing protein [Echinococcus granulosus]
MSDSPDDSDDEFFDCTEPFPSKFYAVAVPRSSPGAGLFANITQAKSRLRSVKGSRLKAFDSIQDASDYSACPVAEGSEHPLPIPEGEIVKFPSIRQADLLRLRKYIEANDIDSIEKCISDNPMYLLTGYDTPTILQLVFRFNAIHIAAKLGHADVIKLIISYLESSEFWARIYPNADVHTAGERRLRVLDLYLNSPETGSLSTPLHLASKFGHVECVRVLASHPATLLDLRDASGATALDTACTRLLVNESLSLEQKSLRRQIIARALDERYVVLVDRSELVGGAEEIKPTILPLGLMGRQLHHLLSATGQLSCPGVSEFCTHLTAHRLAAAAAATPSTPPASPTPMSPPLPFSPRSMVSPPRQSPVAAVHSPSVAGIDGTARGSSADLRAFGVTGHLVRVRAILGPLDTEEAQRAVASWRRPQNPFWTNLRLMDAEKGYERYGRRLATELDTKWTEHWAFLDDFADLRSDYGLGLLNDYLAQFYVSTKNTQQSPAVTHGSFPCHILNFNESMEESSPKRTPNKRVKCEKNGTSVVWSNAREGLCPWTAYREDNNPEQVLSDGLEGSSSSSTSSGNSYSMECDVDPKFPSPKQMSPVIGMLNNFIVSSPLRFILPPFCAGGSSPTMSRPEKRISMFSHSEDVTSTPLRHAPLTPSRKTTSAKQKSARRHVIYGMWPSLLEARTSDRGSRTTHLHASITPAEVSVRNALNCDVTPDENSNQNWTRGIGVNLENYPFVKQWKRELDLSIQHS